MATPVCPGSPGVPAPLAAALTVQAALPAGAAFNGWRGRRCGDGRLRWRRGRAGGGRWRRLGGGVPGCRRRALARCGRGGGCSGLVGGRGGALVRGRTAVAV